MKNKEHLLLNSDYNKKRFDRIQQVLMEAASGNFNYRAERSGRNDALEATTVMTNIAMEELDALFIGMDYHDYVAENSINLTAFYLDEQLVIRALHPHIADILSWDPDFMAGKPLDDFLAEDSRAACKSIRQRLKHKSEVNENVKLFFRTENGLVIPAACNISSLFGDPLPQGKTVSLTFQHVKIQQGEALTHLMARSQEKILELKTTKQITLRMTDVRSLRNIHNYILRHLEQPLPSMKVLAHTFGINEFKLKNGFNQLYGVPVFRFHRQQRLKRAKFLIQTTEMYVKDIAKLAGYPDTSHFTKAFKKQYGCTPRTFKGIPWEEEESTAAGL
ncbi:helix-turn-helix domain-containing protein [Sinomicrobium sp. M5D2P9]